MQGFSLGPARFLSGWVLWMGVKGVAGAVLLLVVAVFWFRHHRLEAVALVLISIPDMLNLLLREVMARPRPTTDLVDVMGGPQGFSFPSGTTLHMLLFYGFLMYLAHRLIPSRPLVWTIWALGGLYILMSGIWVIYGGRHWFIDAVGGYLFGSFYLLVLVLSFRWAEGWITTEGALRLSDRALRFLGKPLGYALRRVA
ncbi:MAG: phosphatase PAP2 family protein [SAR202 cluster bacterium]|mgnify:CR=1 FL=1|nr:phosphatase PAP2 family protein [SAR202 cluster bacterium]